MRQREHQSGFSVLEALLVVVAVGVISTAGWFVYQHNRVKTTEAAPNTNTTSNQQTTTTPPTPTVGYLDIKEWGVRLTLDSTTASLYYYIKLDLPGVAYLSLRSISAVAPTCAADNGPLAAIGRLTEAEHQAIVSGTAPGNPGTVHIGSYWYSYQGSHADCTDGTPATQAAVRNAAPNFDSTTLQKTFTTLAADPSSN